MKQDFSDYPIMVIPLKDGGYKFYPINIEVITAFLEKEREEKLKKDKSYCGAV